MTDYDTDTHFDKRLPRLDYNETTIINNKLTTFSHKLEYISLPLEAHLNTLTRIRSQ